MSVLPAFGGLKLGPYVLVRRIFSDKVYFGIAFGIINHYYK